MCRLARMTLIAALPVLASCERRAEDSASAQTARRAAGSNASAPSVCPLRLTDVRLGVDSIGGLPTRRSVEVLQTLCPDARLDTVGVGGMTSPALRFNAPGVTLWAIQTQYDAYGDSLHADEPADLWAASGDSLRFPDGVPVPRTIGLLRALDSAAVIVVDRGDDGTGSYVVRCRYPHFALVVSNMWPGFADSGIVPFVRASPSDTAGVWRVEIDPARTPVAVEQACKFAPAI